MSWTVSSVLDELQTVDESERIEAKRGLGEAAMKSVSAFCNEPGLGGGWVVFGVHRDEETGEYEVVGVPDPDRLQTELVTQCRSRFNRAVVPEVKVESVEGRVVVAAFVSEAPPGDKPVYLKKLGLPKGAWRRIGSVDQGVTDVDLQRLASLAQSVPFEQRPLPGARRADLDPDAVASLRRQLREARPTSELLTYDEEDLLEAIGALDAEGRPTVMGVLLLGSRAALRRLLPSMRIDVLTSAGTALGDDYEVVEVREALVTAWRRVHLAVESTLPRRVTLTPDSVTRTETPRIPSVVLREAIVNALMHRDYEVSGGVQVRIFRDRMEIENPGYSLIAPSELGRPQSRSRNPQLAEVMHDLDLAERRGTGIRRMREAMHAAGLPLPTVRSERGANSFQLTLHQHHLLDKDTVDWLARYRDLRLNHGEIGILLQLRQHRRIANADVRELTGLGTHAATLRLRGLRDQGVIVQKGAGRSTYYELADGAGQSPPPDQPHLFPSHEAAGDKSGTSRGQVGDKSKVSDAERDLLHFAKTPRTMSELMEHAGWSSRSSFLERLVGPLRERGWLRLTIPDKPRSSKQKYETTPKGRVALGEEP